MSVNHRQKQNGLGQDNVLPTHSAPTTRRCSGSRMQHPSASRSGNIRSHRHDQVETPALHSARKLLRYVTDGVWYAYADTPKTRPGANFDSSDRQCWRPVEPMAVPLPGLLTPRMSHGACFVSGDTGYVLSAKQQMPNGEAITRSCVNRLPRKFCQRVGEPCCLSLTTVRGSGINSRYL